MLSPGLQNPFRFFAALFACSDVGTASTHCVSAVEMGLRAEVWTKFKERFSIPHTIEFYAASEGTFSLFNIEEEPGAIGHVPPFLRPNFPAVIVRYDPERQEPYRDEQGRCVRCRANEAGEALGPTGGPHNPDARFEGYVNSAETEKKIARDVFE
jgi:fatty-acyl-CoA synthase